MQTQDIFNMLIAAIGALGAFVARLVFSRLDRHDRLLEEFPREYVAKADYDRDIRYVKDRLDAIVDKLGAKVDK